MMVSVKDSRAVVGASPYDESYYQLDKLRFSLLCCIKFLLRLQGRLDLGKLLGRQTADLAAIDPPALMTKQSSAFL